MGKSSKKNVIDSATEATEGILPALESAFNDARQKAAPYIADARDKAGPIIQDAYDKAGPMLHDAKEKAVPMIQDARDKAAPYIAEGKALAAEKAVAGRDATVAKVNELRGIEPEPKKGSKVKKFLIVGAIAGLAGVVYKKLTGGSSAGDNWQSTYTPAPAPSAPAAAASAPTQQPLHPAAVAADQAQDDQAAATPGEALSDAADAPHPDTTPDNPAEVVDLDTDKND